MFSFQHIEYLTGLLVLVPLVWLYVLVLRWKKKTRNAIGDEVLVNRLTPNYSQRRYTVKFILVLLALIAGILALANLRKPAKENKEIKAGIDVMIALDVSKSMLSQDIKPSRLDKAKQCINLLIDGLGDNRLGFVVFAGQAFLQMPLTSDAAAAKIFLANVSTDIVPLQGTVIADALKLCDESLDTKQKKYKSIILISDGEDHDPQSAEAIQQLYDHGVIVHTIGIGTTEGAYILEPATGEYKRDINGQTVVSKLNEKELENIAQKTGGKYYHLTNTITTTSDVINTLNTMEKKAIGGTNGNRQYSSLFPFFISLCLLFLVAELCIPETKKMQL